MAKLPLAAGIAASTAVLAYLDARWFVSWDVHLFTNVMKSLFHVRRLEKVDHHNTFYVLEQRALDPKIGPSCFLVYQGRQWTYRQAYDLVLRYGTWLKTECGVVPGEVIAMDFTNNDAFVWIWFGLWAIGAKPAFINYNLAGQPLFHTLRTSTARLVLVEEEELKKTINDDVVAELSKPDFRGAGKGPMEIKLISKATRQHIAGINGVREPDTARANQQGNGMSMLIYTSGTTGMPKPAVVAWNRVNRASAFVSGWLGIKPTDRMYTCMPLYHSSASLLVLCSVLYAGATVILDHHFSVKTFWPTARAENATIIHYVGETCRYLLSATPSLLDKQHKVRLAFGNGLRPDVWTRFKERFAIDTIAEFYAATEGVGGTWNISSNALSAGAIGRSGKLLNLIFGGSFRLVELDIVTEFPRRDPKTGLCIEVLAGGAGELLHKLDPAALDADYQGYFNDSRASNKKIIRDVFAKGDAYYRTGDLIKFDNERRAYFIDRIGDTFRWKSENVSTSEVSEVMGVHPAVAEANVYGVQLPGHDGRAGCAACVLNEAPSEQLMSNLAKHARQNLAPYALPLFLRIVPSFATTGTNKTVKHLLREQGVDPDKVKKGGPEDQLFWLRGDAYVPFSEASYKAMAAGDVRL